MTSPTTIFPLNGPISLRVRLGHGSITVATRDHLVEAAVRLSPRDPRSDVLDRTTAQMEGTTLAVTGPRQAGLAHIMAGWRRDRDGIDAVIEVPTDTPITISSASEEVAVTGRSGDTDIATSAARISVEAVGGHLRLRYGNADSAVGAVTGSVQLSAGRGNARFGDVGGSLECQLGNGALDVEVLRGDLHTRSGRGSAHLRAAYGNVDVALGSGPITIGIPPGIVAHVDVTSGTGDVRSDLPVEQSPGQAHRTIRVRAMTGAGDIRILKAAPA